MFLVIDTGAVAGPSVSPRLVLKHIKLDPSPRATLVITTA